MKFKNGHWLLKKDVKALYAAECYMPRRVGYTLTMLAPAAPVRSRGDTLQPALEVTLSSPMQGVIRVTCTHHRGQKRQLPQFDMKREDIPCDIAVNGEYAVLRSGDLEARVTCVPGRWGISYCQNGECLTASGERSLAHMTDARAGEAYMTDALNLDVGETVYGLGERFGAFVKNGQSIDIWNEDGGTCSEQAYKNVPFYLSSKGYGVFVDTPAEVMYEIGSEHVERVNFAVKGETLSYLIFAGSSPKDALCRYTALLGRPALPPAWSMGLWLSTSFTTEYDETTVTRELLDGMKARDIPVHVFHYDCFWMKGFHWCDFAWDEQSFPDPRGMLSRLKARGLHVCVWVNPYIAQASPLFAEGMEKGYLVMRQDGSVWQTDLWQAGMGLVDFTNPEATLWYQSKLKTLLEMGVDCFKTDFGERIPVRGIVWHDDSSPLRMHNYYTQLYNEAVFGLLQQTRGENDAVVFARSATAGGQKLPVHWGGDCLATFPSMAETLRAGLSLSCCGFGFWSHDIGGFEMTAPASVYKRWCAFGLLSSHSRLHGSSSYRVPWHFDEEACDVLRFFTRQKCALMPYLYQKAVEAHERGVPVLRPMFLEFPDDPACRALDTQYMLGDALLVAPVFREDGRVTYYLPDGVWTHLIDGRVMRGGRYVTETYGYLSLPLWVRQGTLLPMGQSDRPDDDYTKLLTLRVYPLCDGQRAEAVIPDAQGRPAAVAACVREGSAYTVECSCPCRIVTWEGGEHLLESNRVSFTVAQNP